MNIKGGALEFDIIANNGQINNALEETKRRIQGFTDATVEGGDRMEAAYREAAAQIEAAFKDIDTMAAIHSNAIADLEKEYARLGEAAGAAFMKGTAKGDEEYRTLTAKQQAIKDEIAQRKALLQEIANTADALQKEEQTLNENKAKVEQNAKAKGMLRTQVMNLKNSLAEMEQAGKRDTDEFRAMQAELGRLADAMADANTQAKIMSDDYRNMNTVLEVMGGISGAFSAAQGAVGLFAGENENLQKIMVKVQSAMSITIGLQQVAKTLNKDSYTQLVLVRKAKELLTVAETKFATALGISNVAAKALMATLTLGLSVAITAVIAVISSFVSKAREAKKAQEELNSKIAEIAVKPVASINELSFAWEKLGDHLADKEKFVKENAEKFKELGVQVNNVYDAENLLVNNKDAFIDAQISKAKALAATSKASEIAQKWLENQLKLEEAQKTPKVTRYVPGDPMTGIGSYTYEIDNPAIKKYEEEGKKLDTEIKKFYELATKSETEGAATLKKTGIKDAKEYADGTIGAYEAEISKLQSELKNNISITDKAAYTAKLKEITELQKKVDAITGESSTSKTTQKDPFTEQLEARKKKYTEYYNWVNSKDEVVRNAAKTEFAGLLKEGSSYLDYLQKQRDQLIKAIGSGTATKTQAEELQKLNNAIATETKETVLAGFEKELKDQLSGARSILEMVNILEEKRKALAGDGSDLDKGKSDIIKKQQEDVEQKAKDRTKALLSDYASYLGEKITFEANYAENSRLLNEQLAKAKTDDERRIALEALANLEKERKKYAKSSGNEDYDALVEEYKTYQQKCADISAQYDEKIALATQQKNEELVAKLQEAKENALSELTLDEIMSSDTFTELFGNLDTLTVSEMIGLRNKLESEWAKLNLSPKELEALRDRLEEVNNQIQTKNPFKALADAIKRYKETQDKDLKKGALKDIFEDAASSINLVKDSFDAVTGALSNMGLVSDEATQQVLSDISNMMSSAAQIASGTPQGIIQGTIGLISSAFDLFNFRDRKLEKQIKKHANSLKQLQRVYNEIERSVDKALGNEKFTTQKDSIENMKQQQKELAAMADAERAKKKTDQGKVDEYENQIIELRHQIEDTVQSMRDDIVGSTAADIATELGNAFIEAFAAGENAAEAFRNKANEVVKNIIQNMLIKKLLEEPVGRIIDKYASKWVDDDGNFAGFDAVINSAGKMGDELAALSSGFAKAMESLPDEIKNQFIEDAAPTTSLSGAIKGASQESIDLLAGQTNAVRVNQVQEIEILRQQLIHLANIDGKLSVSNRHLEQIEKNTSGSAFDPLRAQGITM